MARRNNVYVGASLVDTVAGIPNIGPFAGRPVRMSRYRGQASHGYRSNYMLQPCEWIKLAVSGERDRSWRYSGKNLPDAARQLAEFRDAIARGEITASD